MSVHRRSLRGLGPVLSALGPQQRIILHTSQHSTTHGCGWCAAKTAPNCCHDNAWVEPFVESFLAVKSLPLVMFSLTHNTNAQFTAKIRARRRRPSLERAAW